MTKMSVDNKFEEILLAAHQARLLKYKGHTGATADKSGVCVQAINDVRSGKVTWASLKQDVLKLDIKY